MLGQAMWAVVIVVAALLAAGCDRSSPASDARPNVVLISIDTLRPDHLGCYGHARPTSPAIDRLAAAGVLFERAVAPSPWTLPSHGSMLTGLLPSRHGLLDAHHVLSPEVPTLAERLAAEGVRTAAFVNVSYLSQRNGLARGFQHFRHFDESHLALSAPRATAEIRAWLDAGGEGPFFLFFHSYDVHSDYRPAPVYRSQFVRPYAGPMDGTTMAMRRIRSGEHVPTPADLDHLRDLYDGAIRQLDDQLAVLFADLDARGLAANTHVFVTSDHGEEFYEHGDVLHGRTLYEEMLRVPLVVRGPGLAAGRRVTETVQLADLPVTILSLFGAEPLAASDGVDLTPLLRGDTQPAFRDRVALSELAPRKLQRDAQDHLVGVRTERHKLIRDLREGRTELYDLERDPRERRDVAADEADTARALLAHAEAYVRGERTVAGDVELTTEQVEQLRALGYAD